MNITPATIADRLNGRQYRKEITRDEEVELNALGIVIVYGASDDLMEFGGAIHDEVDCNNGGTAFLTVEGLLENDCGDSECPYFEKIKLAAIPIEAIWDKEGYSWIYHTDIPHVPFDIMEDDEKYCRGIAFYLADAK